MESPSLPQFKHLESSSHKRGGNWPSEYSRGQQAGLNLALRMLEKVTRHAAASKHWGSACGGRSPAPVPLRAVLGLPAAQSQGHHLLGGPPAGVPGKRCPAAFLILDRALVSCAGGRGGGSPGALGGGRVVTRRPLWGPQVELQR